MCFCIIYFRVVGPRCKECLQSSLSRNISLKQWSTACHYFQLSKLSWLEFGNVLFSRYLQFLPIWIRITVNIVFQNMYKSLQFTYEYETHLCHDGITDTECKKLITGMIQSVIFPLWFFVQMASESVLTAIDLYRLDLHVYAHRGLPRFYMPKSFHERVDSLLLLLCRQCPYLHTLVLQPGWANSTQCNIQSCCLISSLLSCLPN